MSVHLFDILGSWSEVSRRFLFFVAEKEGFMNFEFVIYLIALFAPTFVLEFAKSFGKELGASLGNSFGEALKAIFRKKISSEIAERGSENESKH